jgi:outer membrane protein TolC
VAQAQEDLARVRQELERNLREVIGEYAGQVAAVSARLLVFRASEESYSIAKDLYAFSRSSLFEVFKAQEDLYAAGQRLIDSLVDRAKSKMRLLHASQRLSGLVASAQATVRPSP